MAQVNPMSDDKVVVIRQPSTANLMIDSLDRNVALYPTAGAFQIQRNYSILNGFFTRLGVTEVALEWAQPNIVTNLNDTFIVTITGDGGSPRTVTLAQGMYTVAQVLDSIVAQMNVITAGVAVFSLVLTDGWVKLSSTVSYTIANTVLANDLGFVIGGAAALTRRTNEVKAANISLYDYIDIISPELTYAQKLKDATTNSNVKDVLCRWYMAFDGPTVPDQYGFPILMGYQPFKCRRIFSPPKQIRWEPNLPIGNLSFEVWSGASGSYDQLNLPAVDSLFNFQLTLQVSEV